MPAWRDRAQALTAGSTASMVWLPLSTVFSAPCTSYAQYKTPRASCALQMPPFVLPGGVHHTMRLLRQTQPLVHRGILAMTLPPDAIIFSGLTEPVCRTSANSVHIPTSPYSYSHREHNLIALASTCIGLNVRVCELAQLCQIESVADTVCNRRKYGSRPFDHTGGVHNTNTGRWESYRYFNLKFRPPAPGRPGDILVLLAFF